MFCGDRQWTLLQELLQPEIKLVPLQPKEKAYETLNSELQLYL